MPLLLVQLSMACAIAVAEPPQTVSTHPMYGVTLTEQVQKDPPLRLYWVQVDVTDPAIHLRVCPGGLAAAPPWEVTLLPVSAIAWREHLDVAVNGSYFAPKDKKVLFGIDDPYFKGNMAMANGWIVCDRVLLSNHPLSLDFSTLVVAGNGKVSISKLTGPPLGARQAVSGIALVRGGRNIVYRGAADELLPRTAVGIDAAGKILTLFVADGHRPNYSQGLTSLQLADLMVKLGCDSAISLDGGGSSTLVVRNGEHWPVLNTPSDGHTLPIPFSIERPVADALGIVVDEPVAK